MATLFNREALLHALVREAPELAGSTLGAGFRLGDVLRESTPLAALVAKKPELAWPVFYFLNDYERYWRLGGTAVDRARVLQGAEVMTEQVGLVLLGEERAAALRMLEGRRRLLAMTPEALDELAAAERIGAAARRGRQNAARRAARTGAPSKEAIAEQVVRLWLTLTKRERTRGLQLFFETLPLSNSAAWDTILERMTSFKGLASKAKKVRSGKKTIIQAFRGDANNLKGLLLELLFWHGPTWARMEKPLLEEAARRARQLSAGGELYKVVLIREPLRLAGQEIFDGAILLVRRHPTDPRIEEAVLHAAFQVKAERKITVIEQILRDMRREAEKALVGLRTLAGDREFVLRAATDGQEAKRIIVLPQVPTAGRMAKAPLGVQIIAVPTLHSAAQLDEPAVFMFEAAGLAAEATRAAP